MNMREARAETEMLIEAGISPIWISSSGVGKSDLDRQMFLRWKEAREKIAGKGTVGYGQMFLATQTPPDLLGVPFKGEKVFEYPDGTTRTITVTDPTVPMWMISDEGKPADAYPGGFWLFLDEYGQGDPDVKKAAAELLLKKKIGYWALPHGSVVVAATNRGARYGVTKDFDFCINRRGQIEIRPDARIFVEDFADKPYRWEGKTWQMMGVSKAWAMQNPGILCEPEPKEQGPWCTPRSLTAADRYLQTKMARLNGQLPTDPLTTETMQGIIGAPATTSLAAHLQFALALPSYEDVVREPMDTPIPNKADLHMLMAYQLAGLTQPQDLASCIKYIGRLPKDMSITYVTALLRRDYKSIMNEPAMQAWIAKNAALVSVIASLSQ